MTVKVFAAILHLASAAAMAWGYQNLERTVLDKWIKAQTGGHFQFLTIQALAFAWITMVISLACDLLPQYTILRAVKRYLFMITMPLATVVSGIYWSLLTLAPSLILLPDPYASEPSSKSVVGLPIDIDLCLHALPALSLLVDFFAFERSYEEREERVLAPGMAALFALWYSNWVEYCARNNGTFPYPFLNNPLYIRVIIYTIVTCIAFLSFRGLNAIHAKLYKPRRPADKKVQ